MKKIFLITFLIIFIPFFIISLFNIDNKDEIKINYMSNTIIRVKRLKYDRIDYIPFEEYIVGVLAGEMPIYFENEALKAQAVASRSYALKRFNDTCDYDVVDSVLNQVYLDNDYLKKTWKDDYIENINKLRTAVNETSLEYLDYNGEIADAMFFSTSNGYTESSDIVFNISLPYLKSVKSSWDEKTSSAFRSTLSIPIDQFYSKLGLSYSDEFNYKILKKSETNRNISLCINGVNFSARALYDKLGLKSTDFTLKRNGNFIIVDTIGYGHGVGMSQYGAEGMALEGYKYNDILNYYYSDVSIKKMNK